MNRLEAHRSFFADLVTASAGLKNDGRLTTAFASTPRERFVGPGPWKIFTQGGYIETPSADPAFLYQDVVVGLAPERKINNGQPVLHAFCLAALNVKEGGKVIHIGAGTGYYTALLARLTGDSQLMQRDILKHSLHPILKKLELEQGGFNIFRRFRITELQTAEVPAALQHTWSGHAKSPMCPRCTKSS